MVYRAHKQRPTTTNHRRENTFGETLSSWVADATALYRTNEEEARVKMQHGWSVFLPLAAWFAKGCEHVHPGQNQPHLRHHAVVHPCPTPGR